MKISLIHRFWLVCLLSLQPFSVLCQEVFEAAQSPGVEAEREPGTVRLHIGPDVQSPIVIPRIAAPIIAMRVTTHGIGEGLRIVPQQDNWEIHWTRKNKGHVGIEMHFDTNPYLLSELRPVLATGDGSFLLPAHRAETKGEKIRYEPQPHKNTIGYWTGKDDSASWKIELSKHGRFNVAVLQGCGKGQGGSTASMTFQRHDKDEPDAKLDFEVKETGHFQNFQWINLGEVELANDGVIELVVAPKQIKKAALMDIRAIHLIRLPDKEK